MKSLEGLIIVFIFIAGSAQAERLTVAVAANFSVPMQRIAAEFEAQTGQRVALAFAASGKAYAQIKNGAPFDIFLSADQHKPQLLEQSGLAVAGSRFTYAIGTLALWSRDTDLIAEGAAVLEQGTFRHLAVANPMLAPYGRAAQQTLASLNLSAALAPKLVFGENISQTFQFVKTGNAQLGFIALSQLVMHENMATGSRWIVPAALHDPIRQDAVLLSRAAENPAATALMAYLKSDEIQRLIHTFGYASELR